MRCRGWPLLEVMWAVAMFLITLRQFFDRTFNTIAYRIASWTVHCDVVQKYTSAAYTFIFFNSAGVYISDMVYKFADVDTK